MHGTKIAIHYNTSHNKSPCRVHILPSVTCMPPAQTTRLKLSHYYVYTYMQQETCVYICACICMVYPKWYHRKGGGVGKAILYYGACLTQSHAQIIFTKIFACSFRASKVWLLVLFVQLFVVFSQNPIHRKNLVENESNRVGNEFASSYK